MDVKVINEFVIAGTKLFREMFGISSSNAPPHLLQDTITHRWDLSALIGVTGTLNGVVALRLNRRMVDNLLDHSGLEYDADNEKLELADSLMAEILNVLAGRAVSNLTSFELDITVPRVIQGKNHQVPWPKSSPVLCIPFRTIAGDYEVLLCFK